MTGDGGRLRVHAVVDAGWRGRAREVLVGGAEGEAREAGSVRLRGREVGFRLVEAEETAAAVTPADAADGDDALLLHARVVEAFLGSRSVVPVPRPLHARGDAAVRRLLERARLPLREALDWFDGCYEVRVHVAGAGGGGRRSGRDRAAPDGVDAGSGAAAGPGAGRVSAEAVWSGGSFRELRSRARGARRLSPASGRLLTAAFLVARDGWIDFVEEASRAGERHRGVDVDVTGPWAPYDFVRFLPEGPPGGDGGEGGRRGGREGGGP